MAGMEEVYRNEIADHGAGLISHIGLVDDTGNELEGGDYSRKAVTWTSASDGTIRPNEDLTFDIPGGATVGGWRGYSEITGGTEYGGADLVNETYTNDGQYTLLADQTGIKHENSSE